MWPDSRSGLVIVKPDTVIRWQRQGFRLYWRRRSRPKRAGHPRIDREIPDLIRRMCIEDTTWGAPKIQAELCLLGHDVAEPLLGGLHHKYRRAA
jgi:putative transposase